MSPDYSGSKLAVRFTTTRWPLVRAAAGPGAGAAREELARLYWFPLYGFARRRGVPAEAAADAVQTFLGRLLTGAALNGVTDEGGRFRSFLLTGLVHELADRQRAEQAAKRRPEGGWVALDGLDPEARLALEPPDARTPEQAYDRWCARALLDAAADRLRHEHAAEPALFEHLLACLDQEPDRETHAAAAQRLALAEGTLRNRLLAFRRRFRELVRQQVAATLEDPGQVEAELRHLLAALSA